MHDQSTLFGDQVPPGKHCSKCKKYKAFSHFPWNTPYRGAVKRRHSHCRECQRKKARAWIADPKNKERYHAGRVRRAYGIPEGEYQAMLAAQGGVCAICKKAERAINPRTGKPRHLDVDHDHKTGKVRGLLCSTCNNGLGCFQDDRQLLASADKYLAQFEP
jgi:hypothetical protein